MEKDLLGSHANDFEIFDELEMGTTNFSTLYKAKSKKLNENEWFIKNHKQKKVSKRKKKIIIKTSRKPKKSFI